MWGVVFMRPMDSPLQTIAESFQQQAHILAWGMEWERQEKVLAKKACASLLLPSPELSLVARTLQG